MGKSKFTSNALRLPVVSLGAEYLVMGNLMRRNILTYKAPPNNEGYDLICIHPDPQKSSKALRIQVKSRYQSDCDRAFPVKEKSFDSFDFLVIVFLNIGYFYRKTIPDKPVYETEFYVLPNTFIREHHHIVKSGWQKVKTKNVNMEEYKDGKGFELIAKALDIPYPTR